MAGPRAVARLPRRSGVTLVRLRPVQPRHSTLISAPEVDRRSESFAERSQLPIEGRRVIPERRVSGVRHDLNLRVGHASLVLVNDGRLDYRILRAVHDQSRLADPW